MTTTNELTLAGAEPVAEVIADGNGLHLLRALPAGTKLYTHASPQNSNMGGEAVPKWIDDPHDIEQGQMLNPAWLKLHGMTAADAAATADFPLGAIENARVYVERVEQEGFECELGRIETCSDWQELRRCFEHLAGWALSQRSVAVAQAFQARVKPWMLECFGEAIASDREERNHRFLEEALELVQSCGCTASEAHQLVDYTFGRPVGAKGQEVGGVMVTLAALCLAQELNMHAEGETELARISAPELVARIRAKQAAKPKHSPLPATPKTCRLDDGRCGICGGDWSVCGCEGMCRRAAAAGPDDTPLETGEGDAR